MLWLCLRDGFDTVSSWVNSMLFPSEALSCPAFERFLDFVGVWSIFDF
jgi:hypothetical protein